jgi:hypothetical protein
MPGGVGGATHFAGLRQKVLPPAANAARRSNRASLAPSKSWRPALLLCFTYLHAAAALAGDLGYGAGGYLSYESNIDRVETNPRRELIASLFGGVSYQETAGDVTGRLYAYVERRHFTQHTFSDDTRGFLEGTGRWTIMPKRLIWLVDETFQDVVLNVTAPATPGNVTKTNSFNTGPELIVPLGPVNALVTGARYGRFDIENSNTDNHRYRGYARVVHTTPARSKFSLNYEASRIFFEPGTPFPEALREDRFVSYETASAAQGLYAGDSARIDIGTSRVVQYASDSSNTLDGHLVRLRLSKAVGRQYTVHAAYSDQISDTYSDLIAGIAGSSGSLVPTDGGVFIVQGGGAATADLYHSKRGELGFTAHGGEIEYTLQPYTRTVDFQTQNQDDYSEIGGVFFWRWALSGATRFAAYANYSARNYDNLERKDTDRNYGMSVDFKLNRTLRLAVVVGQNQRQSTAPGISYVDQRAMLLLGYSANYELRTMLSR